MKLKKYGTRYKCEIQYMPIDLSDGYDHGCSAESVPRLRPFNEKL